MAVLLGKTLPNGGDPTPVDYDAATSVEPATWENAYDRIGGDLLFLAAAALPRIVASPADLAGLSDDPTPPRLAVVEVDVDLRPRMYYLATSGRYTGATAPQGSYQYDADPTRWWCQLLSPAPVDDGAGGYVPAPPPESPPPTPTSPWSTYYQTPYTGGAYDTGGEFVEADVRTTQAAPVVTLPQRRKLPGGGYEFVLRFADVDLTPFEPERVENGLDIHRCQFQVTAAVRQPPGHPFFGTMPLVELLEHRSDGTSLTLRTYEVPPTSPVYGGQITLLASTHEVAAGSSYSLRIVRADLGDGAHGLRVTHDPA